MPLTHPWFTFVTCALSVFFIYMVCKVLIDIDTRLNNLRSALGSLLRISACRCNKAGTCAYCNASKLLEKEERLAYEMRKRAQQYDSDQTF